MLSRHLATPAMFSALSSILSLWAAPASAQILINEVLASTESTDWEYIELFNAGASPVDISGFRIELWDSDAPTAFGGSDGASPYIIPGTTILNPGGHYLFANDLAKTAFNVTPSYNLPSNAIENSSFTVLLRDATNSSTLNSILVVDSAADLSRANRAGTLITPDLTIGPDGTFMPAGFTRTTDGGSTLAILPFNYANLTATGSLATPRNDGVSFFSSLSGLTIMEIQGTGNASPYLATTAKTTGVVTRINDNGFFMQDPTGDADPSTSDGIFVFTNSAPNVAAGDQVEVIGNVNESGNRTQIDGSGLSVLKTGTGTIAPISINLPTTSPTDLEKFEGMLVQVDQPLKLAEYFNLDRYGEVRLTTQLVSSYTDTNAPSVAGYAAHVQQIANTTITLDDGRSDENPHPLPLIGDPLPPANEPVKVIRRGDEFTNVVGTLDFSFGNWNIDPTEAPVITSVNPRPASVPDVGGSLKIATINMLNYFNGNGMGGGFPNARGATTLADFQVQSDKLVATIQGTGAHIVALQEMENDGGGPNSAIQTLIDELNAAAMPGESWGYVNTGVVGSDAIVVGFAYRTDKVATLGGFSILDSSVDPNFDSSFNRPAIAQTFTELATGEKLTLINNHLKSKGSAADEPGDADQGDGQGFSNYTRLQAAIALQQWALTDPTGSGDPDFLILGDLNSYAKEDPISFLTSNGYTDLLSHFGGSESYSYVFDGQTGSLDHLLANASLFDQVTGAAAWHINSDEPDAYDYNTGFGKSSEYTAFGVFRSSDHDPLVVGLNLVPIPEPTTLPVLLVLGSMVYNLRRRGC